MLLINHNDSVSYVSQNGVKVSRRKGEYWEIFTDGNNIIVQERNGRVPVPVKNSSAICDLLWSDLHFFGYADPLNLDGCLAMLNTFFFLRLKVLSLFTNLSKYLWYRVQLMVLIQFLHGQHLQQ